MFPNLDALVDGALREHGYQSNGLPPGQQAQAPSANPQLAFTAPPTAQALPAPVAAVGHKVGRALRSTTVQKIAGTLPVVGGGMLIGGVVLGALWLSRRIEHGPAKKSESHLRLDTATIAPVIAAVIVGALVLWIVRRIRDLHETAKLLEAGAGMPGPGSPSMAATVGPPGAAPGVPTFTPPGTTAETPEGAMAEAQKLLAGVF